jgi:pilus assembly protein CpaE
MGEVMGMGSVAPVARRRVLLLNDEPGLAHKVAQDPALAVIGQADGGDLCLKMVSQLRPDVLLLNGRLMNDGDLERVMARARLLRPGLEVACLCGSGERGSPLVQDRLFPPSAGPGLPPGAGSGGPPGWAGPGGSSRWEQADMDAVRARGAAGDPLIPMLVAVYSPKGGTGKTVLAVNLACVLARHLRGQVALVDLDLSFGDAAIHLDFLSGPTLADAVPGLEGDKLEVSEFLHHHPATHLRFLASPAKPELAEFIRPEHARQVIACLRAEYPVVIVDLPSETSSDHVLDTLEAATHIVLVCTPDTASVRRCRLFLDVLAKLESIERSKIVLAVNRQDPSLGLATSRVGHFLGAATSVEIPEARARVEGGILEGHPPGATEGEDPFLVGVRQLAVALWPGFPAESRSARGRLSLFRHGGSR